jgi:SAM-dependent methyltransferase
VKDRMLKRRIWNGLPKPVRRAISFGWRHAPGKTLEWGTLRRLEPLSPRLGNDRGTPTNRYYYKKFLVEHRADIAGHVMEVKEDYYTSELASGPVTLTIVDIKADNPLINLCADLALPGSLPAETFDCAIVTGVLQFVSDVDAAVQNLYASLRPGGVALIIVPTVARVDTEDFEYDRWRMTPTGLSTVASRACAGADIVTKGYGNILAAVAFLYGIAAEELAHDELEYDDPVYPLIACAVVRKPHAPSVAGPATTA